MSTLDVQNECQAVISLASPLSAMHWREYVLDNWDKLTQGVTGETIKFMVLAGVHGDQKGKVGGDANNLKDCENQAVIFSFLPFFLVFM